jgi:UDP-2,3-diacylglucosamine pyrophosphatase LpxH
MSSAFYDTLILSDLHLGSEVSRAEDATRMLTENGFRRLILLGDIFSDLNFRRLTKEHWKFLSYIRKLSNPKRGIEVVWVEGNHDQGLSTVMSHLVGVKVYQEYAWEYAGVRHLAIHGHQFDRFMVNSWFLSTINTYIHLQVQKFDFTGKWFSRLVDRLGTRWLRLTPKVASGALAHAQLRQAQRIFCGHTHAALYRRQDSVEYYNTGGWIDSKPTYVTVDADGVRIHDFEGEYAEREEHEKVRVNDEKEQHERSDHRDSGEERGQADPTSAEFPDDAGLFDDAEYEGVGS